MKKQNSNAAARVDQTAADGPRCHRRFVRHCEIEQPTRITEDGHLFFLRGYSGGFAAEFGIRLTREQYEAQCVEGLGPGKVDEIDGKFIFVPNVELTRRMGASPFC